MRPSISEYSFDCSASVCFISALVYSILGFQILDGVGIVAIAQPEIIVDARVTVNGDRFRRGLGDGWCDIGGDQRSGHESQENCFTKHPFPA